MTNLAGAGYARAGTRAWASGHLYSLSHSVSNLTPTVVPLLHSVSAPAVERASLLHRVSVKARGYVRMVHRVIALRQETASLSHRVEGPTSVRRPLSHRVSNRMELIRLSHRVVVPRAHNADLLHRVEADEPVFQIGNPLPPGFPTVCMPHILAGRSRWDAAWQLRMSDVELRVWAGLNAGRDFSGIPYRLVVSHQRSAAATWSLYTVDDLGIYHPCKAGGEYSGVLGWTKDHRIRAVVKWGGREFTYTGPATGFSHQRSARDGWFRDAVWSGIDESKPLFEKSVTMPTVRSTKRRIQQAVQVFQEILAKAKLSGAGFRNFPIRLLHRQDGRYGDWLMRLLEVSGQQWRMQGRTFTCYDSLQGHGPIYTYSANTAVASEGYDATLADVLTRVTVKRLVERDVDDVQTPEVAVTFGKYTKTFSSPLSAVRSIPIVETGGVFSDFIARSPAGNVVAVWGVRGGVWPTFLLGRQANNVVAVEYTFGAKPGVVATEGYGEILFTGTSGDKPDEEDFPSGFNSNLTREVFDGELESKFGQIREELELNELIATAAQADSFGRGHLNKLKAALFPLRVTVPLNPDLVDGSRVRLVDDTLGTSIDRIVISATHTFDADPTQCVTTFTCGGYLP